MTDNKEIVDFNDTKSIVQLLLSPLKLAEVLTGWLVSESETRKLSAGRLIQAAIKHKFLTQLGKELKEYIEKGQIKEDYLVTHKNQLSLHELLKFIDDEIPDEERFKAMKSILFVSISSEEETLAYELMKICKKISSGGLLVLKACWDIVNRKINFDSQNRDFSKVTGRLEWLNLISKQIGHSIHSLVEVYENELIELKLIGDVRHIDKSGFEKQKNFRLTELGLKLCEYITKFP